MAVHHALIRWSGLGLMLLAPAVRADVSRSDAPLLPSQAGTRWIYRTEEGKEAAYRILASERSGRATRVWLERSDYLAWGRVVQILVIDSEGIHCVETKSGSTHHRYEPQWSYLRSASPRPAEWTMKSKSAGSDWEESDRMTFEQGTETIEVPAGRFRAKRARMTLVTGNRDTVYTSTYWFAPRVGIVKFEFVNVTSGNRWVNELKAMQRP